MSFISEALPVPLSLSCASFCVYPPESSLNISMPHCRYWTMLPHLTPAYRVPYSSPPVLCRHLKLYPFPSLYRAVLFMPNLPSPPP